MPCHCKFPKPLILPVLFALSWVYLFAVRKPNAEETAKFLHFTTAEVGHALFVQNWWVMIPITLVGVSPAWVWNAAFGLLSLFGWVSALRFTFYYYVSAQFPAVTARLTAAVAGSHETVKWLVPVCTTPLAQGGCSWTADLHINHMTQLWWDDALWLLLVTAIFVVIEGLRYRVPATKIVAFLVALVALGWDTVTPLWLLFLRRRELSFAASGEPKRDIGRWTWLYVVLAECAVCSWWPALLEWAVTRGTVFGQFDDGMVLPAGARATLLIIGTFWGWAAYFCADTKVGPSGVVGWALTGFVRFGIVCLLLSHVAGAVAIVLLYREMCPHATLVSHRLPDPAFPDDVQAYESRNAADAANATADGKKKRA